MEGRRKNGWKKGERGEADRHLHSKKLRQYERIYNEK